ncbi:M20 family metallopeptidase [Proteinivorax hydrogeniformans]|uniref:M20 family metallopeptidase n=1 Tax=Proteinivorax hydrogeniformans TaxID=1826727 RepID=A0AAU8HQ92_9FIRM
MELSRELQEELTRIRRQLHKIPEVAFDLPKTYKIIKEYLVNYGYTPKTVAKKGLVAVKQGKSKDAIAFRADMDGLNVYEKNDVDYSSIHEGKMHACGHDGHMAILLGFAKVLSKIQSVNKTIILIFQPAEEGPGGAKEMIAEGVLDKYNVESIFGIHIFPGLQQGKFGLTDGPLMAQNGEVDIRVEGSSSHGALPHQGSDAIVAASNLVMSFQNIPSRKVDPLEPSVVTLGTVSGGEARNIIPKNVKLTGTIRAFNTEIYDEIKKQMSSVCKGIEEMYDVKVKLDIRDFYPPVINDTKLYEKVRLGFDKASVTKVKPLMLAEDFSFYQQKVPGLFILLGSQNDQKGFNFPLHNGNFNFDESILVDGVNAYLRICETLDVI